MNVWAWFDEREMFAHCMMGITVAHAPAIAALYPFHEVTRVCDVGARAPRYARRRSGPGAHRRHRRAPIRYLAPPGKARRFNHCSQRRRDKIHLRRREELF
jgi:hypothetical protein